MSIIGNLYRDSYVCVCVSVYISMLTRRSLERSPDNDLKAEQYHYYSYLDLQFLALRRNCKTRKTQYRDEL